MLALPRDPLLSMICLGAWLLFAPRTCTPARGDDLADLVLQNGKIVTVDPQFPTVQALAVQQDRIAAVGTTAEIAKRIGPQTRVIDLEGKLVIPGFIEGHGHFLGLGQSMTMLDLTSAQTWDDIVAQVAAAAREAPAQTWILGRGWHQSKWSRAPEPAVEGTPTHNALSQLTPDHPVLLSHASGHMVIANARAMQLAGLTTDTPAPAGGQILRDAAGQLTGVLRENAAAIAWRAHAASEAQRSPQEQHEQVLKVVGQATAQCLAHGVTSFHDAGCSLRLVDTYKSLAEQGQLSVRLWVMLDADQLAQTQESYRMIGVGHNHLTVRAIKLFMDGALGSHGAWLLEPYDDLPTSSGLNTISLEDLQRTAELAIQQEYQLCVHAIGDRANREVLDLYQRTFQAHPERRNLRWRIEHAQHLHPDDIPRFAQLGVIAAMQALHATSDGPFVVARLGERRARTGAYVWQSLLQSGAVVVNGSDVPVEEIDPIAGFHAAVTRRMASGEPFFAEQCMTREQALRSYTLDAAYAAFEDDVKGSLTPGKLADMVVLSQDIMTVPAEQIRQTRVMFTILGGKVLYEAPPERAPASASRLPHRKTPPLFSAPDWPGRTRRLWSAWLRLFRDARSPRRPVPHWSGDRGDARGDSRPVLRERTVPWCRNCLAAGIPSEACPTCGFTRETTQTRNQTGIGLP